MPHKFISYDFTIPDVSYILPIKNTQSSEIFSLEAYPEDNLHPFTCFLVRFRSRNHLTAQTHSRGRSKPQTPPEIGEKPQEEPLPPPADHAMPPQPCPPQPARDTSAHAQSGPFPAQPLLRLRDLSHLKSPHIPRPPLILSRRYRRRDLLFPLLRERQSLTGSFLASLPESSTACSVILLAARSCPSAAAPPCRHLRTALPEGGRYHSRWVGGGSRPSAAVVPPGPACPPAAGSAWCFPRRSSFGCREWSKCRPGQTRLFTMRPPKVVPWRRLVGVSFGMYTAEEIR